MLFNLKKLMPGFKLTLLVTAGLCLLIPCMSDEDSAPELAKREVVPMVPPNTVKGVRHQAKDGDFALLRGKFTQQKESDLFSFTDDGRHFIDVRFDQGAVPSDFTLNSPYFLWGQMQKHFGERGTLHAVFLSPKAGAVRLRVTVINE